MKLKLRNPRERYIAGVTMDGQKVTWSSRTHQTVPDVSRAAEEMALRKGGKPVWVAFPKS